MSNRIIGADVGTGNIVVAVQKDKQIEINSMRNMFLLVSPEDIQSSEIANTQLDYIEQKNEDGDTEFLCIVGEDAFRFANIFGQPVRRPMEQGVISNKDIDAVDVIAKMFEKLAGINDKGYCVYSVPAQAVDIDMPSVLFHEKVFGRIFKTLGYDSKPLNEAMAIVYSECANTNFSGIGISFGAGLTNVCVSYKGVPAITFSIGRGGDWIDQNAAKATGVVANKATALKERKLDLNELTFKSAKRDEKKTLEALKYYYEDLIEHVLKTIVKEFEKNSSIDIDEDIPIIISGGTSMATGFVDLFNDVLNGITNLPFGISEVRQAKDPLNAVAAGCLIYALWEKKKENKGKELKEPVEKSKNDQK